MIVTERLLLRRARCEDLGDLHRVFADPRAMRYWDRLPHADIAETRRWLQGMIAFDPAADRRLRRRAPTAARSARPAAGASARSASSCIPTTGARASPARRSRRSSPTSSPRLPVDRLEADVDPRNAASLRLLGRLGFREVRRAERTIRVGDEWCDSVYLELPRP